MLLLFLFGLTQQAFSEEKIKLKAYTAKLPPFTINPSAKKPGFLHELVTEIAKRANVDLTIDYLPWKRSQEIVANTPNTIIFGLGRSKKREAKYSWLAKVLEYNYVFVTTKSPVNSYEEAKKLKNIIVLLGTPREQILRTKNFTNFRAVSKVVSGARSIHMGKADAWMTLDYRAAYFWHKEGFPGESLVIGKPLKTSQNWIAGNKVLPDGLKERFKQSLASIKADGFFQTLHRKYFGDLKQ